MPPELLEQAEHDTALDLLFPKPKPLSKWHNDPAGFVADCYDWTGLTGPTDYQLATLNDLAEHGRIAIRGPHGLGKTTTNSWLIHWFANTRDLAGLDWKAITTASAWRQLTHYLWPEVHKWARLLRWDVIGRDPYTKFELLDWKLKLATGEAFAVACTDPATIEGAHANQLLLVYDEAKAIPANTFDATEGAFSGAGADNNLEAYAIASSTPGDTNGRFYEIHTHKPGLEDWHTRHVTKDQVQVAGRMSEAWAEQRARQWGPTSAVYLNRVEGEFAASEEDAVIPLAWIGQAQQRWKDQAADETFKLGGLDTIGVDVARSGSDHTVLALCHGWTIAELRHTHLEDTMQTTGRVAGVLAGQGGIAIVDVIGIGAGVVDRLREQGHTVIAFNAGEGAAHLLDSSGELGFVNKRSAAWWHMREILDPANNVPVALPDDDLLVGDLTAPKWRVTSGGRIQVESKDDIRKRLGRSTDDADAVIQAFWPERPIEQLGDIVEVSELEDVEVRISPY